MPHVAAPGTGHTAGTGGAGLPTTRAVAQHVRGIGLGGARVTRLATACDASNGKAMCVGHT